MTSIERLRRQVEEWGLQEALSKAWQLLLKDGPSSVLWRQDWQFLCGENSSKKTKHLSIIFQRAKNHGIMMIRCYFSIWQATQLFHGKKKILVNPKAVSSLCLLLQQKRESLAPPKTHVIRNLPGIQILWLPQSQPTVNADLQRYLHSQGQQGFCVETLNHALAALHTVTDQPCLRLDHQTLSHHKMRPFYLSPWLPASKWLRDIIYPLIPAL